MKLKLLSAVCCSVLAYAIPATAQVVTLDFEGVAPYPNGSNVFVRDFYNGGTSSNGASGANLGAGFGANALLICLNTAGFRCGASNTSRGGVGDPASALGGLFFLAGSETFLNYAAGFTTGFSFNYTAPNQGGTIGVYDGLNGTGNLLTSLTLATTASACDPTYSASFCPFVPAGVGFTGTARSIGFGGAANQIVFDDITFGSVIPGVSPAVPEPGAWATLLLGFGIVGAGLRFRLRFPKLRFVAART